MPMTEKLFYEDPFLKEFSATILDCREEKGQWIVTLDRTAFYPEGGGQPADHGTLGNVKVFDTKEKIGEILHFCEGPLKAGETVQGAVDWARRFDFMQQHSGEHIVSGILCGKFGCDNVGFHIGHELVTIDFNAELSTEDVLFVENLANQYIWEDLAIQIQWPSPAQLEAMEYRSKKALSGAVRIVSWPGADCCACCGTHVTYPAQVGLIKLLSMEKFREGVRIQLVCGGRAFRYLNRTWNQNAQVSRFLSAKPFETAGAVERLLEENAALKSRLMALEDARFAQLAGQYAGPGDVVLFEDGLSPDALRRLCGAVLHACGDSCFCACFSGDDSSGYKYAIGQPNGHLRDWVKSLNQALNGRGGGKDDFVQGSVQASRSEIKAFFQAAIREGTAP